MGGTRDILDVQTELCQTLKPPSLAGVEGWLSEQVSERLMVGIHKCPPTVKVTAPTLTREENGKELAVGNGIVTFSVGKLPTKKRNWCIVLLKDSTHMGVRSVGPQNEPMVEGRKAEYRR